jgi:arylsulfatase A-like enzyme
MAAEPAFPVVIYAKDKTPDGEQNNPTYAAMIESMDEGVGRVLAALDELKLADNTVVLFYYDNGGQLGITEQKPLRAGKGFMYEGGIRVPMIVRSPGVTQAGRKCETPVIGTDLAPSENAAVDPWVSSTAAIA